MPQTEAQQRASKKWAETHREENIKRISECIKKRYDNDEEFRKRKQDTERERQRTKKAIIIAARDAAKASASQADANADALILAKMEKIQQTQTTVYGF